MAHNAKVCQSILANFYFHVTCLHDSLQPALLSTFATIQACYFAN